MTILDSVRNAPKAETDCINTDKDKRKAAALELAGLWKSHNEELSVEETIRIMRRGRQFDN